MPAATTDPKLAVDEIAQRYVETLILWQQLERTLPDGVYEAALDYNLVPIPARDGLPPIESRAQIVGRLQGIQNDLHKIGRTSPALAERIERFRWQVASSIAQAFVLHLPGKFSTGDTTWMTYFVHLRPLDVTDTVWPDRSSDPIEDALQTHLERCDILYTQPDVRPTESEIRTSLDSAMSTLAEMMGLEYREGETVRVVFGTDDQMQAYNTACCTTDSSGDMYVTVNLKNTLLWAFGTGSQTVIHEGSHAWLEQLKVAEANGEVGLEALVLGTPNVYTPGFEAIADVGPLIFPKLADSMPPEAVARCNLAVARHLTWLTAVRAGEALIASGVSPKAATDALFPHVLERIPAALHGGSADPEGYRRMRKAALFGLLTGEPRKTYMVAYGVGIATLLGLVGAPRIPTMSQSDIRDLYVIPKTVGELLGVVRSLGGTTRLFDSAMAMRPPSLTVAPATLASPQGGSALGVEH